MEMNMSMTRRVTDVSGWDLPTGLIGAGRVMSTASSLSLSSRREPSSSADLLCRASARAFLSSLANRPAAGRSSGVRERSPFRTSVSSPFLPRYRTLTACSSAGSPATPVSDRALRRISSIFAT